MHLFPDKRKVPPVLEEDLYKIKNIDKLIKKERRYDELDRLNEVSQQKKVWRNVMLICGLFNLALIFLALIGRFN